MFRGAAVRRVEGVGAWSRAAAPLPSPSDYAFLLEGLVDSATLARAEAIAGRCGVLPHAVMIANGWLSASDYYRALAKHCGVPFHGEIRPGEVTAPTSLTSPRQCLASGLLKARGRAGGYLLAPEILRPNAVKEMLARLKPYRVAVAPPHALRRAVCGHFAKRFAATAVDSLRARHPDRSARGGLAPWQRLWLGFSAAGLTVALALAPLASIRALTFGLAALFLPVIGLRVLAARDLILGARGRSALSPPRLPDAALPVYTILVPLYREANMLAPLMRVLARLDYPALGSKRTKRMRSF
jgi:hypothetical protein